MNTFTINSQFILYFSRKKNKRRFSNYFLFLLVFTWHINNVTAQWNGAGSENDPWRITDKKDLIALRDAVNNGNSMFNFADKFFKLTADIDLNGEDWIPIGTVVWASPDSKAFSGSFDGDGHSIRGISVNGDYLSAGLFGYIRVENTKGYVKNLHLNGSMISSYNGDVGECYIGALVGRLAVSGGDVSSEYIIDNCSSDVTIIGNENKVCYIGGIIGTHHGFNITNTNSAAIFNQYNKKDSLTGSNNNILRYNNQIKALGNGIGTVTINKCVNYAELTGKNGSFMGGIVGNSYLAFAGSIVISQCTNKGCLTGEGRLVGGIIGSRSGFGQITISQCTNGGTIRGIHAIGGIIGYNHRASERIGSDVVIMCVNNGSVIGKYISTEVGSFVGGMLGYNVRSVSLNAGMVFINRCVNSGLIKGVSGCDIGGINGSSRGSINIKNCINSGSISGKESNLRAGGIVGYCVCENINLTKKIEINNCYHYAAFDDGMFITGGIAGKLEVNNTEFGNINVANCYWLQDGNINKNLNNIGYLSDNGITVAETVKPMAVADYAVASNFVDWDMEYLNYDGSRPFPKDIAKVEGILGIRVIIPQTYDGTIQNLQSNMYTLAEIPAETDVHLYTDTIRAMMLNGTNRIIVTGFGLLGQDADRYTLLNIPVTISPNKIAVTANNVEMDYTGFIYDESKNSVTYEGIAQDENPLDGILNYTYWQNGKQVVPIEAGVYIIRLSGLFVKDDMDNYNSVISFADGMLTIKIPTGYNEMPKPMVTLYPNPTKMQVTIETEQMMGEKIEIYDVSGKPIRVFTIKDSKTIIDVSYLPSGIYFVKTGKQTTKFIKL